MNSSIQTLNNDGFDKSEEQLFLSLLRLLMSYMNEDGSVGPSDATIVEQRRLVHQCLSALLACGISPRTPALKRSFDWLIASENGRRANEVNYYVVPHKIEAAIEMDRAGEDFCSRAMELLLERRNQQNPTQFDIPGENPSPFKSLWIFKILSIHPDAERYADILQESLQMLSNIYQQLSHRDLSLLISLYATNVNSASFRAAPLREMVDRLIDGHKRGLFDVNIELEPRLTDMFQYGLRADIVSDIEAETHYSLVSTCYVISNLAQFSTRSNRIHQCVQTSLDALRNLLPETPEKIAETFLEPYKQVMLTARALVAFSANHKSGIASAILPYMIQEIVDNDRRSAKQTDEVSKERLRKVIRRWIQVDWSESGYKHLGGGYSGATVVRIHPKLMIPSDSEGEMIQASVPGFDSVIIKFGEKHQFDTERENYASIPNAYRGYFASIPRKAFQEIVDNQAVEYLVIADLVNYTTLQDIISAGLRTDFRHYLTQQLLEFLDVLYSIPAIERSTAGMLRKFYITPIFSSLSIIHEFIQQFGSLNQDDQKSLRSIETLASNGQLLENFPISTMHGDLNIRNILVKGSTTLNAELKFRLIDLDKFTRSGDLAYDIGEFIIDVQNVQNRQNLKTGILDMSDKVEDHFLKYALENGDMNFELRLKIAKTRSLLKLVEIECKLGLTAPHVSNIYEHIRNKINGPLARAYQMLEESASQINRERL